MKTRNEVIAILLLGGSGTRFGTKTPKQFIKMGEMPLMVYPLKVLEESQEVEKVLLVVSKEYEGVALDIAKSYSINKIMGVAPSGDSREESVRNALNYLKENGENDEAIILIHDGDRPNIDESIIKANVEAAKTYGAAVTAIKMKDSIILSHRGTTIDGYADRNEIYRAQTPQTFRLSLILEAIKQQGTGFTDDGSIVLANGGTVQIVEGKESNIKITTPEDMKLFLAMKGESLCQK